MIHHLLQTYAILNAIRDTGTRIRAIQKTATETEMELSVRLNEVVYRCANFHDEIDKMTHFINGLHPSINQLLHSSVKVNHVGR